MKHNNTSFLSQTPSTLETLLQLRACPGLLYSNFYNYPPTLFSQTPSTLETLLQKNVEFNANSTFFLEHLKMYSQNTRFEPTHRVLSH
jgi:hypothetical protein